MKKSYWGKVSERRRGRKKGEYHVAHRVTLEAEFVGEIEEDVFDFFGGHGYLSVSGPGGVVLSETGSAKEVGEGGVGVVCGGRGVLVIGGCAGETVCGGGGDGMSVG